MKSSSKKSKYFGKVSPSGVFCGDCSLYRDTCLGASASKTDWCELNKRVELCAAKRGIDFCYNCSQYPCPEFKLLVKKWKALGQDLKMNQNLLERLGPEKFKQLYNSSYFK